MASREQDGEPEKAGAGRDKELSGRALYGENSAGLAERYYSNKDYLTKIFKETYGSTIKGYIIAKRITRAKQLLRFTDMTVDEIGNAVGMGDANYFSRTFRKVEGISPREYRKQW